MKTREELALSLCGKYVKEALTNLEKYFEVAQLEPGMRKIIVDAFAELQREQATILNKK